MIPPPLTFLGRTLAFDRRARLVAVVNVTPDSFSDGGRVKDVDEAVGFALRSMELGADVLDVGGESTRPGAAGVPADEEIRRVAPVIRALAAQTRAPIAVDTCKAEVARAAVAAGASIVNDISGGKFDAAMIDVVAASGAAFVLGHVRGDSIAAVHASESAPPTFDEVRDELCASLAALPAELRARTIVDPCLGFGKKGAAANLPLVARAGELAAATGRPVMIGPSRKRFLGELTGKPVSERDDATVGACLAAAGAGAHFLRVHDVGRVRDALVVFSAATESAP